MINLIQIIKTAKGEDPCPLGTYIMYREDLKIPQGWELLTEENLARHKRDNPEIYGVQLPDVPGA